MCPVLLQLGPIHIYSYGLMVFLGSLTATFLLSREFSRRNQNPDIIWNLSLWILAGGIIGGRMLYVLLNTDFFLSNPAEIIMLWHGGLVWYGAFCAGLLSAVVFLKISHMDVLNTLDLVGPFVALGQAIGRIGCFLNGCCYGRHAWRGLYFPVHNDYLIPTQIFSSLALIFIFLLLRILQSRPHHKGSIFLAYITFYSISRFMIEFIRGDSPREYFGFTVFQVISFILLLVSLYLWIVIYASARKMRGNA